MGYLPSHLTECPDIGIHFFSELFCQRKTLVREKYQARRDVNIGSVCDSTQFREPLNISFPRHCKRSEAIQYTDLEQVFWIAASLLSSQRQLIRGSLGFPGKTGSHYRPNYRLPIITSLHY